VVIKAIFIGGICIGGEESVEIGGVFVAFESAVGPGERLSNVRPGIDATRTVRRSSSSSETDEANASSKPATFMTMLRFGGHSIIPPAEATPRKGIKSTGMEKPAVRSL